MGARYIRDLLKTKPYIATGDPFDEDDPVCCTTIWKDAHKGRSMKRQLSKARRRQWRAEVRGEHPHSSVHWESECNWKGW